MDKPHLPPLTALRAFESAGRLSSFTTAASELSVTPGAISRQIGVLEDFLGIQMFVRSGRNVSLTPTGKKYFVELTNAFAQIRRATAQITLLPANTPLRISTSITFTMRWLMPRLMVFHSLHSDANLDLRMNTAPVEFQCDDVDAAIKLGQEETPHSIVRALFTPDLVAVCSPKLVEEIGPFNDPAALAQMTLLHSTARPGNWSRWLDAAGCRDLHGARNLNLESSSLAYQAAIDGVGFAIAQLPFIINDLKSGKLVTPFPFCPQDDCAYNLIWPNRSPRNPAFASFRSWISREAAQTEMQAKVLKTEICAGVTPAM